MLSGLNLRETNRRKHISARTNVAGVGGAGVVTCEVSSAGAVRTRVEPGDGRDGLREAGKTRCGAAIRVINVSGEYVGERGAAGGGGWEILFLFFLDARCTVCALENRARTRTARVREEGVASGGELKSKSDREDGKQR